VTIDCSDGCPIPDLVPGAFPLDSGDLEVRQ